MRVSEITSYKNNPIYQKATSLFSPDAIEKAPIPDWMRQVNRRQHQFEVFTNYLEQHGFRPLGKGAFAVVYEKEGYPWVFKIFNNDLMYLKYLRWVKLNQNNPHVPKIKGNLIKINNQTFLIRMEKLDKLSLPRDTNLSRLVSILSKSTNVRNPDHMPEEDQMFLEDHYPDMMDVLRSISTIRNATIDIHDENIMMRGNVPVLVDPVMDRFKI